MRRIAGWLLTTVALWTAPVCGQTAGDIEERLLGRYRRAEEASERLRLVNERDFPAWARLDALGDPDRRVRAAALARLGKYAWGRSEPWGPLHLVEDTEPALRAAAVKAFSRYRVRSRTAGILIDRLADDDAAVRSAARETLERLVPGDEATRRRLLEALGSRDPDDRAAARRSILDALDLADGGPDAWSAALDDADPIRRRLAIGNLAHAVLCPCRPWWGAVEVRHARRILAATRDPDRKVRSEAIDALKCLKLREPPILPEGDARRRLMELLADPTPRARMLAVRSLGAFKLDVSEVTRVCRVADDPAAEVREKFLACVPYANWPKCPALVRALIRRAKAAGGNEQEEAVHALGACGRAAREAAPLLARLVRDSSREEYARGSALTALGRVGIPDAPTLDDVIRLLEVEDLGDSAAAAIGDLGPGQAWAVPRLTALLADDSSRRPDVRESVMRAFARMGPKAASALAAVRALTVDPKAHGLRFRRLLALESMQGNPPPTATTLIERFGKDIGKWPDGAFAEKRPWRESAEELLAALDDPRTEVRWWALDRLRWRPSVPAGSIPAVARRLGDSSVHVRRLVLSVLASRKERAAPAVPALAAALAAADPDSERPEVRAERDEILDLLKALGPRAEPALPALLAALDAQPKYAYDLVGVLGAIGVPSLEAMRERADHASPTMRRRVAGAFGRIGAPAVADLIRLLDDPSPLVRSAAASWIGSIGPAARDAGPALVQRLKDDLGFVRLFAAVALGEIDAKPDIAVPALRHALRDRFRFVRHAATSALAAREAADRGSPRGATR